ncbi:MAG: Hpt domain-containing protein [Candidatus Magnetominusculus sp. LBB02]|nr:Hpt domain-containing protein [Candidatus Magnetominusculus sp. LBB02]MCG6551411.1 Hpt domain-containing protein [Candidatus Magnetominusculus sp. LBB02]MCG6551413.1 Hpt domain-containing protein [Candidatus Magnetominusculus sp. LBB02]MCG6551415.1 Hpt domain-containing protein [Candidatus Magnetominusculus sp. LBB02]MCG6551417.1 Hpt domain-containing protein [Candidatus Magnetominusculus sp. LBB02]
MNFNDDAEFLESYVRETTERLNNIEVKLLLLTKRQAAYDDQIRIIFRDAHSIKSGASLLQLKNIVSLAHNLENVLQIFREKRILPDDKTIGVVLDAIDTIRELIDNITQSNAQDITLQVAKLQDLCQRLNS